MPSTSLFNLTRFTSLAAGDVIPAVDISDTTHSAHGSVDAITVTNFFATIPVPVVVTSASANAIAAGRQGATDPAFLVDASTVSSVTGVKIKSAAAAAGVALSVISSGANENLTVDAKGSGTVTLGGTSTGSVVLARLVRLGGAAVGGAADGEMNLANLKSLRGIRAADGVAVSLIRLRADDQVNIDADGGGTLFGGAVTLEGGVLTVDVASASALMVGPNGATNPSFQVDSSTASSATGLKVKSAAAAGGLAVSVVSSGANENLTTDAKGSGTITIGGTSTGAVSIPRALSIAGALTGVLGLTSRTHLPEATATYDLGATGTRWQNAWLSGKVFASAGFATTPGGVVTTPGSVIRRLPVYDMSDVFVGYLPVYDNIT